MAKNSASFGYRNGRSLLHPLHPLTKLALAVGLSLAAFLGPGYWVGLSVAGGLLVLTVASRCLRPVLGPAAGLFLPLAIALCVIQGLLQPDRTGVIGSWGPFELSTEGIVATVTYACRLAVIMLCAILLVASTRPKELAVGLTQRGLSPKLAYVVLAAMQFVPDAQARVRRIVQAQQARGLDVRANLATRFRSLLSIVIPLFSGALVTAETRALALEARGFNRTGERTSLLVLSEAMVDKVARVAVVILVVLALVWRVVTWL